MNYQYPDVRLIIFSKPPIAGKCKTRLIPMLGEQRAAELHHELTHACLQECTQEQLCETELWCGSSIDHPFFKSLAHCYPVTLMQQQGKNLGERMFNAFQAKSDRKFSIIIGTDCPVMSRAYIQNAIDALSDTKDIVIGPAEDGGYVLLGLCRPEQQLFTDIQWGSGSVYQETMQRIAQLNLSYTVLETLWDLDRPADYRRYKNEQSKIIINKYSSL
ncbi:MAG: TIGR04282 family arsenosugar biosynthesis glycosyltransferase [Gammaproteobacteria bacterium]|nr:TIGR04282 family arsenosugar biosynthesis glycosyltransferase [Gammaproteobacteria bacterium]